MIPEEEVLESNSGQWLRFNDILVDEFAMNDPAMEAECFGGSYKAKPNDRELLLPFCCYAITHVALQEKF